ncbi:MAG: 16S rRNA processing protein RimM [Euzebyales bacterium]|nr:16S rRNA processing protein RimM [Euzebyales bacterium]
MPDSSADVLVGVVGKPFGMNGDVYVHPDPDVEHDFAAGTRYRLPGGRAVTVADTHLHGNRRLVRFVEADDRQGAESLRGTQLRLPRDEVPLEQDAVWADTLIGRQVRDDGGALVGVVAAVADGPAHDYVVVRRGGGGELLIPAVAALVTLTDDAVVVQALPGLLDPAGEPDPDRGP